MHVSFRHLKAGAICIVVVCNVVFFKCIIANFVVLAKLTVFLIFLDCDLFFLFTVHCSQFLAFIRSRLVASEGCIDGA